MVSAEEARQIIAESATALATEVRHIDEVLGYVLAENVFSVTDIPGFDQSAMDGYAVRHADVASPLRLAGEMYAGVAHRLILNAGEAIRVFTGAPIPLNADMVVMQEKTALKNGRVYVLDQNTKNGLNIRQQGDELKAGNVIAVKGTVLSPATIGLLAGAGISKVCVYRKPKLCLVVTGNELQQPGIPLEFGQVYDANGYQLKAALQQDGINSVAVYRAADNIADLISILQQAIASGDMIILTGGVSVGDYDYVVQVLSTLGVTQHFHKIKQKPGKPMFFGTKEDKLVFGLPGNPASALTCFYVYVRPAIAALCGRESSFRGNVYAQTEHTFIKPAGMTYFLKGFHERGKVRILDAQESYRLSSFARANCLIELAASQTGIAIDDKVKIFFLNKRYDE